MKKLFLITIFLLFVSCGGHKIIFSDNFCTSINDSQKEVILNKHKAYEDIFSLLIFTSRFDNSQIIIENNNVKIDEKINTSQSLGLAKTFKVNNNFNAVIKFKDHVIKLTQQNLRQYKYIYFHKDIYKKGNPYTVTFSNTLCGFK